MKKTSNKIKVAIKKRLNTGTKKLVEVKLEVDQKLFAGPDWLVSLGRLRSFDESLRDGLKQVVLDYIKSAEEQLSANSAVTSTNKTQAVNS